MGKTQLISSQFCCFSDPSVSSPLSLCHSFLSVTTSYFFPSFLILLSFPPFVSTYVTSEFMEGCLPCACLLISLIPLPQCHISVVDPKSFPWVEGPSHVGRIPVSGLEVSTVGRKSSLFPLFVGLSAYSPPSANTTPWSFHHLEGNLGSCFAFTWSG